jgi:hypothetical protein
MLATSIRMTDNINPFPVVRGNGFCLRSALALPYRYRMSASSKSANHRSRPVSRFGIPRVVRIGGKVFAERPPIRQPIFRDRSPLVAKPGVMAGTAIELRRVPEAAGGFASHLIVLSVPDEFSLNVPIENSLVGV